MATSTMERYGDVVAVAQWMYVDPPKNKVPGGPEHD